MAPHTHKKGPRSHRRHLEQKGELVEKKQIFLNALKKRVGGKIQRDPLDPVAVLRAKLRVDSDLHDLIETSLGLAIQASFGLDELVREALEWPADIPCYLNFLEGYAKWIPQQTADPAFLVPGKDDQYQEVYVRLCHFYFLIDQPITVGDDTVVAQVDPWFREWLVTYADYWGVFLDTAESFNDEVMNSFIDNAPQYEVKKSMIMIDGELVPNNPSGWLTFNQFFARELNGGLRPIDSPFDNSIVTSSADCTFMETYPIDVDSNVVSSSPTRIKMTHTIGNITDLLEGSDYKDSFANGTYVHYFLNTFSYHRFHAPVAGRLVECRAIPGLTYLDVKIIDGQFDAPDSAEDGYEFYQSRGLTVWDTAGSPYGDIGLVAALPVGMAQVSSVYMTGTVGRQYLKGDEYGYFQFGGSDMILLFQEGALKSLLAKSPTDYLHYGTPVAKCNVMSSNTK